MIRGVNVNSGDLMGRRFNGYDLRPYLCDHDISMRQLVYWNRHSDAEFVDKAFDYPGNRYVTRGINKVERELSMHARLHPHSWTLPYHKAVREADVVHLHIIHDGFYSLSALPFLTRRKPTVWTWHDPWAMTGHCLHPMECTRYQHGCGACPDLSRLFSMKKDRTAEQFAWKDRTYAKTKADVIVSSKWMQDLVEKAPLARHFQVHRIPFGLDLGRYRPRDQEAARRRFGVLPGRPVLLLRAISSPYKGLHQFIAALEHLSDDLQLSIIVLQEDGHFDRWIGRHQIIEHGWTNDEDLLIDAYAACDFFVMASSAESFGLMAIEAMACARPVVSFDGTAVAGITYAPEIGLSARTGDPVALAGAIERLSRDLDECAGRGAASRRLAEELYDIREQARRTASLYREVIARRSKTNIEVS